jgi:DNA polymerase-4
MEIAIVHMDLDTFFVSCDRLGNSKLEGILLITGGCNHGKIKCTTKFGKISA